MAAIPVTITNAGRAKIIANGLSGTIAKVVAGTGYDSTPADAASVVTPYSPVKEYPIVAGTQSDAMLQVVWQEGETAAGADYSPTELAFLDNDGLCIGYSGVSTGSLFTKGTAPHQWTFLGTLLNLPAGATINFTASVGYFVATTVIKGVVELATDAEVATPPGNARALSTDNMDAIADKVIADKVETYQWSEITIDSDAGTGWRGRISSVDSSGAITGIENSGGTGYATGDTATVKAGVGTGATLTVAVAGGVPTVSVNAAGSGYGVAKPLTLAAGVEYRLYEAVD